MIDWDISLSEARRIISADDSNSVDLMIASHTICFSVDATWEDLLDCLRHPGLVTEIAVLTLYQATGRAVPADVRQYDSDSESWAIYLAANGFRSVTLASTR